MAEHDKTLPSRADSVGPTNAFTRFTEKEAEQSIPGRFEQIVRRHPHRIAVKAKDHTLTYVELDRAANRVAHALLTRCGAGNEPIALFFKPSASLITASLGVLKAGKAYAPIDCSLPHARATEILEDLQAQLILTDRDNLAFVGRLVRDPAKVVDVESLDGDPSDDHPGLSISPEHLAYIHYTSGSTGTPKGVVANHRTEIHNIMKNTNALHVSPDDRVSLLRANNAGASRDAFLALLNGAGLFPLDVKAEGLASLSRWLINEAISVYTCVATIFRHSLKTAVAKHKFPNVRLIHVGGEPVYTTDVELYKEHFADHCIFVNRYSASETEAVAYFFINKDTEIDGDRVPVGHPLEGNEILLLDDDGREVGANRVGEIAVRSRYLAVGYWRRPELTRAKFLPDPSGRRTYLTGDLGYRLPDGCLVHVGRKDFQLKIRGHRVEASEIELALLALPGVEQAAVVPCQDAMGEQAFAAYVAPRNGQTLTVKQLRELLSAKLPDYMLPFSIDILERLPMTASGKIDRQALPVPARSRDGSDQAHGQPGSPVEQLLINLWTEVMGVKRLAAHDDFSELGGNSLAAARIVSRISDIFSIDCPISVLLDAPTVEKLSEWLIRHEAAPGQTEKIAAILIKIESMSMPDVQRAARN